jgi:hypothetical protein
LRHDLAIQAAIALGAMGTNGAHNHPAALAAFTPNDDRVVVAHVATKKALTASGCKGILNKYTMSSQESSSASSLIAPSVSTFDHIFGFGTLMIAFGTTNPALVSVSPRKNSLRSKTSLSASVIA